MLRLLFGSSSAPLRLPFGSSSAPLRPSLAQGLGTRSFRALSPFKHRSVRELRRFARLHSLRIGWSPQHSLDKESLQPCPLAQLFQFCAIAGLLLHHLSVEISAMPSRAAFSNVFHHGIAFSVSSTFPFPVSSTFPFLTLCSQLPSSCFLLPLLSLP